MVLELSHELCKLIFDCQVGCNALDFYSIQLGSQHFFFIRIQMGIPTKVISEHLGHCDTRTTENIYAHVFAETLAQTSDAISQALAGTGEEETQH